jgi:hypothetical protein
MIARTCGLVALLGAMLGVFAGSASADVKPYTVLGSTSNHSGTTIPFFSSSFTTGGVTYPFTMVGSSPWGPAATTTVPTEIVPLRFVFADGSVFSAKQVVPAAVASPMWKSATFLSGRTQYGDAMQRAEFWSVISPGYHVLLGRPTVLPSVTIDVPANQGTIEPAGTTFGTHIALKTVALVNYSWFGSHYDNIINSMHLSARSLPMLLTHDVFLDVKTPAACCVGGFHSTSASRSGNGTRQVQTAIFADYGSQQALGHVGQGPSSFAEDINALSHEVAEWMNDPFGSNTAPAWQSPIAPQYGCNNALEVGDPLVGVSFNVNGYHPQDEAFFSWFSHDVPSIGLMGRYSYLGTFTSPSPNC